MKNGKRLPVRIGMAAAILPLTLAVMVCPAFAEELPEETLPDPVEQTAGYPEEQPEENETDPEEQTPADPEEQPEQNVTETEQESAALAETPAAGLVEEDGQLYYILEDGSRHTGFLHLDSGYYWFGEDGTALTDGYHDFEQDGVSYGYYFAEDGTAFTDGYLEIDGSAYYFLSNGQAYRSGYKTVDIGGQEYYYYFGEDGKAVTDSAETVAFGADEELYYFGSDGRAVSGGFFTAGGNRYYAGEDSRLEKSGWFTVGYGCYSARTNGTLRLSTTVDGYALDASGRSVEKFIDEEQKRVNSSGFTLNYNTAPDGLAADGSLCIVVLGQRLNEDGTVSDELEGRLWAALACAKKYPNAWIAVTGSGKVTLTTEAEQMANWLTAHGVSANRIIMETRAPGTATNAVYTDNILVRDHPKIQELLLVSSDYHMRTAWLCFAADLAYRNSDIRVAGNAVSYSGKAESSAETQNFWLHQVSLSY